MASGDLSGAMCYCIRGGCGADGRLYGARLSDRGMGALAKPAEEQLGTGTRRIKPGCAAGRRHDRYRFERNRPVGQLVRCFTVCLTWSPAWRVTCFPGIEDSPFPQNAYKE